ncbi:MAG: YbhB/YbcL family Raf kinase inhibitor-like protein [Thermodesulfobacteriota bacterium]
MGFRIESPDFTEGGSIPERFSCDGEDISPQLAWDGAPEGTKSFVLTIEDPDAPMGTFVHWVVYDLPPSAHGLERGIGSGPIGLDGTKGGRTGFGHERYGGPCPPRGHGRHRYFFTIRALDIPGLGLPDGAGKGLIEKAVKGHVLAEASIMGVYER